MRYRCSFGRIATIAFTAKAALLIIFLMTRPATGQIDDRAAKVLSSCQQAMGSQKDDAAFVGEGEIHYRDSSPTEHLLWKTKGHELSRLEFSGPSGKSIHVVNHGSGFHERDSKREILPFHHTAYYRNEMIPALTCATDRWRSGMLADYVGTELAEGRSVSHLRFHMAVRGKNKHQDAVEELLSEYHVFIDNTTYRVASVRNWVFSPEAVENRSLWEATYSDYRDVEGVLMPFHIQNRVAGQPYREVVMSSIGIDANLSDKDFQ